MNKAVLISIQPKWCDLIASGKKTIEIRKTFPKIKPPFKCYIYKTTKAERLSDVKPDFGMVIGEFVCGTRSFKIIPTSSGVEYGLLDLLNKGRVTADELRNYLDEKGGWAWHITDLMIYNEPKYLREFIKPCESDLYCEVCAMYSEFTEQCGNKALRLSRPPQSWCYVEELIGGADHAD